MSRIQIAVLLVSAALPAFAETVSVSAVLCTGANVTVVASVSQGCQAQSSYLTGAAVGGTIHTVDFNTGAATDPFGVATYTGGLMSNGSGLNLDSTAWITANGSSGASTITINFNTAIVYFGLYWGSNDGAANMVTIKDGSTTVATFNGTSAGTISSDSYFSFNASGGTFNQVIISSPGCCFETDNHAYVTAVTAAPEPSTTAMMGLGFLGLAATLQASRKRQAAKR